MRIQHNIAALNSHRNLTNNNSSVSKNLEKLSSGYRINRAGDDAAGLAISEKMRAQVTGLATAQKNAEDGVSLVQTAEGALTEVHSMLNRMVELATQSANGTYSAANRGEMQKEIDALVDEIDRISDTANFNGTKLFDGTKDMTLKVSVGSEVAKTTRGTTMISLNGASVEVDTLKFTANMTYGDTISIGGTTFKYVQTVQDGEKNTFSSTALTGGATTSLGAVAANFGLTLLGDVGNTTGLYATANGVIVDLHVGESSDEANKMTVGVRNMNAEDLGISADKMDITTADKAKVAIDVINSAIDTVSSTRSDLGALQNRLEHTINNLGVQNENITAAEARIRDVDMAKEMMNYTKNNILVQASQAMLAQANQVPQGVLQLLQ